VKYVSGTRLGGSKRWAPASQLSRAQARKNSLQESAAEDVVDTFLTALRELAFRAEWARQWDGSLLCKAKQNVTGVMIANLYMGAYERFREICLSLPETSEVFVENWGHPTFLV